jgi:hypothetical protein
MEIPPASSKQQQREQNDRENEAQKKACGAAE